MRLWDTASGATLGTLWGNSGKVWCLAALPRGLLASGCADGRVRVWSVAARACVAVLQWHTRSVYGLAALADGRLASGSLGDDGVICVWDVAHLNAGAPATAAGTTGPPCPTCNVVSPASNAHLNRRKQN